MMPLCATATRSRVSWLTFARQQQCSGLGIEAQRAAIARFAEAEIQSEHGSIHRERNSTRVVIQLGYARSGAEGSSATTRPSGTRRRVISIATHPVPAPLPTCPLWASELTSLSQRRSRFSARPTDSLATCFAKQDCLAGKWQQFALGQTLKPSAGGFRASSRSLRAQLINNQSRFQS